MTLSPTRIGGLLSRMALVMGAIVLCLICVETIFRLYFLQPKLPQTSESFNRLISHNWPHHDDLSRKGDEFRIVGLADSFGTESGPRNYHAFLQKSLCEQGKNITVVNISVPEFELGDELSLWLKFGAGLKPDLLLHAIFIGNDLDLFTGELVTYKNISVRTELGLTAFLPVELLHARWLKRFLRVVKDRRQQKQEQARNFPMGTFSRQEFLRIERNRIGVCRLGADKTMGWPRSLAILRQMKERAESLGARYAIVIHPDEFQVEPSLFQEIVETYHLPVDQFDLEAPQRAIRAFCQSQRIPCCDLLPIMQKEGIGGLYTLQNTHYNEQGNKVAAQAITEFLIDENLVPVLQGEVAPVPR